MTILELTLRRSNRYRHAFFRLLEMITMRLKIYRPRSEKEIEGEMMVNRHDWEEALREWTRILVFDTETTGVDARNDYILSLSWQVLDNKLQKIEEQTRYFKNPLPEGQVRGALKVNSLTNKVLEKLGTTDKRQALEKFVAVIKSCDVLVGHNVWFDITVVKSECKREHVEFDDNFMYFDTMKDMQTFCLYYHKPRMRKWLKLKELTRMLGIDTTDIDWHKSASDVEATARCLRDIIAKGLATSPWKRSNNENM